MAESTTLKGETGEKKKYFILRTLFPELPHNKLNDPQEIAMRQVFREAGDKGSKEQLVPLINVKILQPNIRLLVWFYIFIVLLLMITQIGITLVHIIDNFDTPESNIILVIDIFYFLVYTNGALVVVFDLFLQTYLILLTTKNLFCCRGKLEHESTSDFIVSILHSYTFRKIINYAYIVVIILLTLDISIEALFNILFGDVSILVFVNMTLLLSSLLIFIGTFVIIYDLL